MNNKIVDIWIELIKRDIEILKYVPPDVINDKAFRSEVCNRYDINRFYEKFPVPLIKLCYKKLNNETKYFLWFKYPSGFKFMLSESIVLDACSYITSNTIRSKYNIFTQTVCEMFYCLLPTLLLINYELYFYIPVEERSLELFSIILPALHERFNCDKTLIELDAFYNATGLSLCNIPNPTYNIYKYYIKNNIFALHSVPDTIDITDIIIELMPSMNITHICSNIHKYLTVELCDIIIENTYAEGCYAIDLLPLHFISLKSAVKFISNRHPLVTDIDNPIYKIVEYTEFISLCNQAGLIGLIDKQYHTSEMYRKFMKRSKEYNTWHNSAKIRDILYKINIKLMDMSLLYCYIDEFPVILEYHIYDLANNPDLPYIIVYILGSKDPHRLLKIPDLYNRLSNDSLEYLIHTYPIFELYISNYIDIYKFNNIILNYVGNIEDHLAIIHKLIDNYSYDDGCHIVKILIHNGCNLLNYSRKYHTPDLLIFYLNNTTQRRRRSYLNEYRLPSSFDKSKFEFDYDSYIQDIVQRPPAEQDDINKSRLKYLKLDIGTGSSIEELTLDHFNDAIKIAEFSDIKLIAKLFSEQKYII